MGRFETPKKKKKITPESGKYPPLENLGIGIANKGSRLDTTSNK